jgi:chorismate lyase
LLNNSFLVAREPKWFEHRLGSQNHLPEDVRSWCYEAYSLTQRLRDYYGNGVAVKVLYNFWRPPFLSECRRLEFPMHRYALIREVLLHVAGKPLLLARTVIPKRTTQVAHRNLAHLGNRPLGEVIFSYPDLERVTMDLTTVAPSIWTPAALAVGNMNQPIYGRRTVYAIHKQPMLVSEFFLPEIVPH